MTYAFENLQVWQQSRILSVEVYNISKSFPPDEKYGLGRQLGRAVISVSSNIAEGSTRWSRKDQARFYEIAFGSLIEVLNQLIIASDLSYIKNNDLQSIRQKIDVIGRMLNALRKSSLARSV